MPTYIEHFPSSKTTLITHTHWYFSIVETFHQHRGGNSIPCWQTTFGKIHEDGTVSNDTGFISFELEPIIDMIETLINEKLTIID